MSAGPTVTPGKKRHVPRGQLCSLPPLSRSQQAELLQSCYRGHKARKVVKRHLKGAKVIGCAWRCHAARRDVRMARSLMLDGQGLTSQEQADLLLLKRLEKKKAELLNKRFDGIHDLDSRMNQENEASKVIQSAWAESQNSKKLKRSAHVICNTMVRFAALRRKERASGGALRLDRRRKLVPSMVPQPEMSSERVVRLQAKLKEVRQRKVDPDDADKNSQRLAELRAWFRGNKTNMWERTVERAELRQETLQLFDTLRTNSTIGDIQRNIKVVPRDVDRGVASLVHRSMLATTCRQDWWNATSFMEDPV